MAIEITKGKFDESTALDVWLARQSTDGCADLIFQRNILISWTLRHEVDASSVERMKLIRHEAFETVSERLMGNMSAISREKINLTLIYVIHRRGHIIDSGGMV